MDLSILGCHHEDIERLYEGSPESISRAIAEFKGQLKQRFRKAAKLVHPDHGGSADDFRNLKQVYDELLDLDLNRPVWLRRTTVILKRKEGYRPVMAEPLSRVTVESGIA